MVILTSDPIEQIKLLMYNNPSPQPQHQGEKMKHKNRILLLALATILTLKIASIANAQTSTQPKCPVNAKCGFFIGPDNFETKIEVSNGARELFKLWNIQLLNNETKLVWNYQSCKSNLSKCTSIDLTGRKKSAEVQREDLNKLVKLTKQGKNMIKVYFEEFDGDSGTYLIMDGKPQNFPKS
jgi:hypothetical protein